MQQTAVAHAAAVVAATALAVGDINSGRLKAALLLEDTNTQTLCATKQMCSNGTSSHLHRPKTR